MAANRALRLERWQGQREERELSPATAEVLRVTISDMADEKSATLSMEAGGRTLLVNASRGAFAVTALLGEDDFYDLVGDTSATGTLPILVGGQSTEYPRKYLVSVEQALVAALEFMHTGTVTVDGGRWDRQGSGSAWEQEG